jgi:hypothetical protein
LGIFNFILMTILIYYTYITDKRSKNHLCKLQKDLKDAEAAPDEILTDEEFDEMLNGFKKEIRELYTKPNHIKIGFIIVIIIISVVRVFYL